MKPTEPQYVLNLYGPIHHGTGGMRVHIGTYGPYPNETEAKKAKAKVRAVWRKHHPAQVTRCMVSIDRVYSEIPEYL